MFDKLIRSPRMYQELIHCWNISNAPKDLGGLPFIAAGLGYHPISKTDYLYKMAREEFLLLMFMIKLMPQLLEKFLE